MTTEPIINDVAHKFFFDFGCGMVFVFKQISQCK
jgi:hypothetical protein